MKTLDPKALLAALITLLVGAVAIPILIIGLIITPSTVANSPDQQLNKCDAQMRAAGMLAQNAPAADITGPNAGNNAQVVVAVGEKMHVPPQGIIVALATALTESQLKNYANDGTGKLAPDQHGIEASLRFPHDAVGRDHGSIGIMQQQWPWWGTMQELMTPAIAARKFYEALYKVSNWQNLPVTVAAQSVQGSAKPDAYAAQEPRARALYAAYRGAGGATDDEEATLVGLSVSTPGDPRAPPQVDGDSSTTSDLCNILRVGVQQQNAAQANPVIHSSEAGVRAVQAAQSQIGLPYVWGGGGPNGPSGGGFDCSGLTSYAIYQASGKTLPRQTYGQVNAGVPVPDLSQMLPGDLVLSNFSERGPEHVQLYAGGGQVVEAQQRGVPVKMSPFPKGKVIIRRVL
ncbi:C40 family peptidase [Mycolicibacterium sphagni]|uniref:Cell wall-associated hydrolase, invasion-associated protein n=1 Tax=Mycolicibacterium sphagni TaxID=1786 RepID=A0ABX2K210_9MYCO|nr:NlpC/P60 family protein [Mycolicibacterium sphagni]NTY62099.1 cell wall-associated hydrolase, invasion-associated protein [Mycolicibacterium sphagni]